MASRDDFETPTVRLKPDATSGFDPGKGPRIPDPESRVPAAQVPLVHTLTTDRGDAGRRLDVVVRRHLTGVQGATRTRVQAWIANGRVEVNGAPVHRVAARTALGDVVTVAIPSSDAAASRGPMSAEEVRLDVLYEDDHLLAVDKPAGVVVHPTHAHSSGTVMNALLWHAREWPEGQRPSLVGRLDKLTSGLLLVAKDAAVHAALQRTLLEKDYLAVVYGRVNVASGRIDLRLERDRHDRRRVVASDDSGAASCRCCDAGSSPAARTRSACTSRRGGGRSWATRYTASLAGRKPPIRRSPPPCGRSPARPSMRGGSR
jgi:23S rRNA-/tRNA-specific pseudouridylate synthase